jgi:MFS transporter, putative metabolite:H+ symporter
MNIAGRLERLPISRFHYTVFAVIGIGMLFDGYDLTVAGFVIPPLQAEKWLDPQTTPLFISLPLLAAAFGSITAGILGDWLGRRILFKLNALIYGLGSLGCGLAVGFDMLLICRTITLFALGTQIVTGYSYMNELTPRLHRGRFQSAVSFLVNGGLPIGALLAWAFIPHLAPGVGWRVMFLLSVVPAFLVFVSQSILPESPRWLVSVGRVVEADAELARIETAIVRRSGRPLAEPPIVPPPRKDLSWGTLIEPGIRGRFALAIVFNICHLVAIYVLVSWLPSILVAKGMTVLKTFAFTAVSFTGGFLGPFVGFLIADRIERRWSVAAAAVVAAIAGFSYAEQSTSAGLLLMGLILVSAIYYISSVGFATYVPEILPTGIRLRGMGTAVLIGRLASAVSPFIVADVLRSGHDPFVIVTGVGALYVILAVAITFTGPRTAGKSLELLEHTNLPTTGG